MNKVTEGIQRLKREVIALNNELLKLEEAYAQEQRAHKGIKEDMPSLFKPPKTGVANNLTTAQSLLTYQWMNLNRIACVFEKTLIFQAIFDYPLISCSLFLSFKSKK